MTRTEFIRKYAEASGMPEAAEFASLGVFGKGDVRMIALPCGCSEDVCDGWVMVSAESVLSHLFFQAPEKLQDAYRQAVIDAGGE